MDVFRNDVRVALRRFVREPGFTAVVVSTLALGLGANIAIFSLIDALILRSLPVERPEELYRLGDDTDCCVNSGLQDNFSLFSYRLFEHLRANAPEFSELAGFQANTSPIGLRRSGASVSESLPGEFVTGNYFSMFGIKAAAGRLLQPDDDRAGAAPVVALSYRAWNRFGLDPSVVGSVVVVNGMPMTVVGVAGREFFGDTIRPDPAAVWIPMAQEVALRREGSLLDRADQNWLYAIGRLRPGASARQVQTRLTTALQQWLASQSFVPESARARVPQQYIALTAGGSGVPLMQAQFSRSLGMLFLTSAVLLLIASANLANLLFARADPGQTAIRTALGASGSRLIRQSLTEGMLLAIIGASLGVVAAAFATRALIALAFPAATFVPVAMTPSMSTVLFAFGLAVATGFLFTGGPAWVMSRSSPLIALSGMGRSGQGRSFVPRRSLVIAQVALSFAMLATAGLLARSLRNLEHQALGFDPADRVVLRIDPPAPLVGSVDRLASFYTQLQERLRRVPGVRDASYALYSPMEGNNWSSGVSIAGRKADPARPDSSSWNRVGPDYFTTTGTRIVGGRAIDERDAPGSRRVAVVNQAFARQFFSESDPLGQRLGIGAAAHSGDFEVVGVAEDVKYQNASQPVRPMIFFPAFQSADYADPSARNVQARSMLMRAIVVHAAGGLGGLEAAFRNAVAEIDPNVNVIRVLSMTDQVSVNFRIERLLARLTSIYGALALILASLGLYGVTAYAVAQRTREIGLRMAIGADRARVMRTVIRGPIIETAAGLAIGLPLALLAGGALKAQLYGVSGQDSKVMAATVAALLVTAAFAAAIPARRAATIDPARALRGE